MTHRVPYEIYVASCTEKGGIYRYGIQQDLFPKQIDAIPFDKPMYMTVSDNKMYVLLKEAFENKTSGILSCSIENDGSLASPSEVISTKGLVACHLAADKNDVYAVNYTSGSVIKLPDKLITHLGKGTHPTRQTSPHTHYINFTPDGLYLFVTDLGLDKIFVYNKELTPISSVDMPNGDGPRHLAYHKDGKHIFCAGELASTVSLLEYEDGRLKLIDTVSTLPEEFSGENTTAAIRCIGNTVYVSNRGHDSIAVIEFKDGALKLVKTVPTYGSSPRDFIVEDGIVIATNERSNNVTFVCVKTGKLISEISVPAPLCVLKRI